jgi:RNA polymerase sigma-70 factor (ECF subfamily)
MSEFVLLNHAPERYLQLGEDEYPAIIEDYIDWLERVTSDGGGDELDAARGGADLEVVYSRLGLGGDPDRGTQAMGRDVAVEALRLACELAEGNATGTPSAKALAALLCLQASRFDAHDIAGAPLAPFGHRSRADRDPGLIELGLDYLRGAMGGARVSRYHLEAGIASLFATAPAWESIDWAALSGCYDKLLAILDSPVAVIDAAVVDAFAGEPKRALARLDALQGDPGLAGYAPYHVARAQFLRMLGRGLEANISYSRAIASGASMPVVAYFEERLPDRRTA